MIWFSIKCTIGIKSIRVYKWCFYIGDIQGKKMILNGWVNLELQKMAFL